MRLSRGIAVFLFLAIFAPEFIFALLGERATPFPLPPELPVEVTVVLFDELVVTEEEVPEAVTVLTQSEDPWEMRHALVASVLCDKEPRLFAAVWPDPREQPPDPLQVRVTLPKSPPAITIEERSNSPPLAAEEADALTVRDLMAITLTLVFVTNVSVEESSCID